MPISRTAIVLICVAVATMTSVSINAFPLFLPPMEREFGWSRAIVTLPYVVSMIGWAVGAVLFGKLADDFGARGVILGGIALMAVGFLGMGLSQNLWQLMLNRRSRRGCATSPVRNGASDLSRSRAEQS